MLLLDSPSGLGLSSDCAVSLQELDDVGQLESAEVLCRSPDGSLDPSGWRGANKDLLTYAHTGDARGSRMSQMSLKDAYRRWNEDMNALYDKQAQPF